MIDVSFMLSDLMVTS